MSALFAGGELARMARATSSVSSFVGFRAFSDRYLSENEIEY